MKLDSIIEGDSIEVLKSLPSNSVDMIFSDPPYNLQLKSNLKRPDHSNVEGVDNDWDKFFSFKEYDNFTYNWLKECRRILKDNGTIWTIGSYHNIYRVGSTLQNIGFWILNDIIWRKSNPMPNFKGRRFTNAQETLIWAAKSEKSKYTFNYDAMKSLNEDLQMRSDWLLPICNGNERLKENGKKVHPTQKPESLLTRVIISSTNIGDIILDPFFGTGSTGAVAKKLSRKWIGIEKDKKYIKYALKRIKNISLFDKEHIELTKSKKEEPRVPFGSLLERGLLKPGEVLFDGRERWFAKVRVDGSLISDRAKGSIHYVGANVQGLPSCNGWTFWHVKHKGIKVSIDSLRSTVKKEMRLKTNTVSNSF